MSKAQRLWLARLARSKCEATRPQGDNFRTWDRVMEALCKGGFAAPYVHGGYVITERGAREHAANVAHAEAESSRGLGNANEASSPAARERWLSFAQRWLDEANDLRGLS